MSVKKWMMKQYWRVGTVRGLFGLTLGMMVLGKYYYVYIPYLAPLGIIGALVLGTALTFLFLFVGYIYDVRLKMWNEMIQVGIDRDPYQNVPNYRSESMDFPAILAFIESMRKLLNKIGESTTNIDDLIRYYSEYFQRSAVKKSDLGEAEKRNAEFLEKHQFSDEEDETIRKRRPFGGRIKKSFLVQVLRVNYIQTLTGLAQDVIVIAALYAPLLLVSSGGSVSVESLMTVIYLISIPLFIILVTLGWIYDKHLKMWGPEYAVRIERDPYSYVPEPRLQIAHFPFLMAFLSVNVQILEKKGLDVTYVREMIQYMKTYSKLQSSSEKDFEIGRNLPSSLKNSGRTKELAK